MHFRLDNRGGDKRCRGSNGWSRTIESDAIRWQRGGSGAQVVYKYCEDTETESWSRTTAKARGVEPLIGSPLIGR